MKQQQRVVVSPRERQQPRIVRVKNQFLFSRDSKSACVPISILALYHLYEQRERVMRDAEWTEVMHRGAAHWRIWKERSGSLRNMPTVREVLALDACRDFVALFGSEPRECAGLVRDLEGVDNPEGSFEAALRQMTTVVCQEGRQVCALVILPRAICISLLCLREANNPGGYRFLLFDSHGSPESEWCDYGEFSDCEAVLGRLVEKRRLVECKVSQEEMRLCDEETLQAAYGYSLMLFIQ